MGETGTNWQELAVLQYLDVHHTDSPSNIGYEVYGRRPRKPQHYARPGAALLQKMAAKGLVRRLVGGYWSHGHYSLTDKGAQVYNAWRKRNG